MLQDSGFTDVVIGEAVDTFGGAKGEDKARAFEVYGYAFMASRPPDNITMANPPAGRPPMTANRSPSKTASSMSCVTKMMVIRYRSHMRGNVKLRAHIRTGAPDA
jgi:hypothetical protein